jgi:hypothetical protein
MRGCRSTSSRPAATQLLAEALDATGRDYDAVDGNAQSMIRAGALISSLQNLTALMEG